MSSFEVNLSQIMNNALAFGLPYLAVGFLFDVPLIKHLTGKRWLISIAISIITHLTSTVIAFYLLPVAVYFVFRNEYSWFATGLLGTASGVPATLTEIYLLKYLFHCTITPESCFKIWTAKTNPWWLLAAIAAALMFIGGLNGD